MSRTLRAIAAFSSFAAVAVALAPSRAEAQAPERNPFVYLGFSTQLGLDLSGVKLFAGYDFGRGNIQGEIYAGALAIPPGPGAGVGLAGKYYVFDEKHWGAALGGQLGVRLGGGFAPVAQLIATGEGRASIFSAYLQLKTGVPQVFGAALGGKISFAERTVWLEANTGVPLLINGEAGYSFGVL